jgi:hypothetical protein
MNRVQQAVLLAAYFRGGDPDAGVWTSNCDQVVTLSLFYTGDISANDCVDRFAVKRYVGKLYQEDGELDAMIADRYRVLIELLQSYPRLFQGGGNFKTPADPTYTSCRLTREGQQFAAILAMNFPAKPDFPHWPDKRGLPSQE